MFTTYRHAEITIDSTDELQSSQLWSYVEQELVLPWFYVQMARLVNNKPYTNMLMLYHAHELKELVDSQSSLAWLEQVHFVTPPYMNGGVHWLMEPLDTVAIIHSPSDGDPVLTFRVSTGVTYSLRSELGLAELPPFKVLFSASNDLRPGQ
jgi:hypothetical protein